MAIAAVPLYLGKDFSSASPGLRFGMYLQLWGVNRRTDEVLWTTHDISYEVRGQNRQEREVKHENKVAALKSATLLTSNDRSTMESLLERQQHLFALSAGTENGMALDAQAVAPFTTGLGNEHPLENGFAFLNPYGLPYLPGSGVKGVLRQAACELSSGEWGDPQGWNAAAVTALFGAEAESDSLTRGALTFWDVIPQIKGDNLSVEIMTPHQKHYYQDDQDGQSPHDSGQPTPITFLTVPPGSGFTFHVQCNQLLLETLAPQLRENNRWRILLEHAFEHAFNWLGFGAKTAVGYGAMAEDTAKKASREQQQAEQREQERKANMSPEDLALEENRQVIAKFRDAFELARKSNYQPGQEFDSKRNEFIQVATSWDEQRSRLEAAELLAETVKWGASKKGKDRLRAAVATLKGDKD